MKNLFTFLLILTAAAINAQNLPNGLTPSEKQALKTYQAPYHNFSERSYSPFFSPPAAPVRAMAEWEESQGYLITWTSYTSMLREIVRYGKQECRMYIVTTTPNNVITDLQNNGIDTTNITFLNIPYNTVWARDYGQNPVYLNNVDSLVLVDWIYNRPRPKDDTIPEGLARNLGIPVYHTTQAPYDLVNTGGNYMSDGMGTAFASKLILEDNDDAIGGFGVTHTEGQIDTIMHDFMGINRYIKMETLPYDGIHHIDMHMKLLDEETILVSEYPTGIADGPQIEANLQYILSNYQTTYGTDWRVVRIPVPDDGGVWPNNFGTYFTYTNASFINKTIIVPTYNKSMDTTALRIWREACPGYKVVGINSTSSIPASGALHCITHEVGVADPLLINHKRLRDTYNTTTAYEVEATIQHRSGIQGATLFYTTDTTQSYQSVAMMNMGNNVFHAQIPAQPAGTEVFYYVWAHSVSGKQQVRPIVAPQGFYNFKVLGNVGIAEGDAVNTIGEIFPNPSHGITCLPLNTSTSQSISIECFNVLGEKVATICNGQTKAGDNKYFINTTGFAAGLYIIRYNIGGQTTSKPLIVR